MTTMRERIAMTIFDKLIARIDDGREPEDICFEAADAVLDELANPSEAMVEAAFGRTYSGFQQSCMDRSARRAAVVRTGAAFTAAIRAARDER